MCNARSFALMLVLAVLLSVLTDGAEAAHAAEQQGVSATNKANAATYGRYTDVSDDLAAQRFLRMLSLPGHVASSCRFLPRLALGGSRTVRQSSCTC